MIWIYTVKISKEFDSPILFFSWSSSWLIPQCRSHKFSSINIPGKLLTCFHSKPFTMISGCHRWSAKDDRQAELQLWIFHFLLKTRKCLLICPLPHFPWTCLDYNMYFEFDSYNINDSNKKKITLNKFINKIKLRDALPADFLYFSSCICCSLLKCKTCHCSDSYLSSSDTCSWGQGKLIKWHW